MTNEFREERKATKEGRGDRKMQRKMNVGTMREKGRGTKENNRKE